IYRASPLHRLHGTPGPLLHKITELPMLYYALHGTRHNKVRTLHARYGRVVRTGPNTVSFLSASAIGQIYSSASAFDKSTAYDVQHLQGEGLFLIKDKATHNVRRRIWNRSFSDHALSQYHDQLVFEVERLIRCLLKKTTDDGKVNLVDILPQYSFDSIVSFAPLQFTSTSIILEYRMPLLDSGDPDRIAPGGSSFFAISEVLTHIEPLFHLAMYIPGISMLLAFEKLSIRAADRRLKNGPSFQDGISHWVCKQTLFPHSYSFISLVSLKATRADTIGGVAVFVLYFLMMNPEWMALLRHELDELEDQSPNHQLRSLDQLATLNSVIQESLRLGTPLPGLPRLVPDGGAVIDGHRIPSGTVVNVPIWAYHLNEEYFPNPTVFDPGRWIENGKFCPTKIMLLAFGGGPFNCVGQKLVFAQFRIFIAMLVLQLEINPTAAFDGPEFWNGIRNRRTTAFSMPLWVQVRPRKRST
ncbi:cytochrome P450, partial [Mycena galericulata]